MEARHKTKLKQENKKHGSGSKKHSKGRDVSKGKKVVRPERNLLLLFFANNVCQNLEVSFSAEPKVIFARKYYYSFFKLKKSAILHRSTLNT